MHAQLERAGEGLWLQFEQLLHIVLSGAVGWIAYLLKCRSVLDAVMWRTALATMQMPLTQSGVLFRHAHPPGCKSSVTLL